MDRLGITLFFTRNSHVMEQLQTLLHRRRVTVILGVLSLSALVWFSYARILTLGFTGWDTLRLIEWSYDQLSLSAASLFSKPLLPGLPYYRPLSNLSYALDFALFRTDARFYQLEDIFIHWATCLAVMILGVHMTRRIVVGWLAGVLLALHPSFGTMVANIANRQDSLATLAILWTLILTHSYFRLQGWRRWLVYPLAWIAFVFALGFKEIGIIALPLSLGIIAYYNRSSVRRILVEAVPFLVIATLYLVLHLRAPPWNSVTRSSITTWNFGLPFLYLQEIVLPEWSSQRFVSIVFFVVCVALALLLWINWRRAAQRFWILLCIVWVVLALGLYIGTNIQELLERYAYVVAAPLMLLIALGITTPVPRTLRVGVGLARFSQVLLLGVAILWIPGASLWGLDHTWLGREKAANAYLNELDQIIEQLPEATTIDLENVPPKLMYLDSMKIWLHLRWSQKKIRLGQQMRARGWRGKKPVLSFKTLENKQHVVIQVNYYTEE